MSDPEFTSRVANTAAGLQVLKEVVERAEADWCGIQDTIEPSRALLLFTSRTTGSTLAVPFNPMSFFADEVLEAVTKRLAASDAQFADRTVPVKLSVLQKAVTTLSALSQELEQLYPSKKEKSHDASRKTK